ncbi:Transmembrane 9 superfamily member [Aphelenchoides besseyi]|nr:Transmembrane 9 superfamily member [Aphelenchoides besseyi]KAI6207966.1 Transmembrane 9 superfamily member [Aphelenchoides besseyi]
MSPWLNEWRRLFDKFVVLLAKCRGYTCHFRLLFIRLPMVVNIGKPKMRRLFLFSIFSLLLGQTDPFYVPGVAPKEFKSGDAVEVKAIKLTSTRTVIPYEFYSLPFCKPENNAIHYKSENLGEVMRGDRIVNTLYKVAMRKDKVCSALCPTDKFETKLTADQSDLLRRRINEDYHVHLLIDNLPAATRYEVPETHEIFFDHGYRLGWVDKDNKVYLNNHLNIILRYHEPVPDVYRVVGFEVRPQSYSTESLKLKEGKDCEVSDDPIKQELVAGMENKISWTYSVHWEASNIPWASRWDVYLSMRDTQIHWFSIINSLVVLACLSGFLAVVIVRTVRRDIAKYNRTEDLEDTIEETGWKLVAGDVFRPPRNSMLLANTVGTGIQLLGMVVVTVTFAMLGMLSPSSRGSLTSVAIFLYCVMGLFAGYHSGRLYKTFKGDQPKKCALRTALLFPSIILGTGFILNFFLISKHSSAAIPFTTMIALLFLWLCVDLPLVFIGHHFGYRKDKYQHPVRNNQIPRQIPEKPYYLKTIPCSLIAGLLPFGAIFIELYFILSAIWENQFYYLFGFLFIVLGIMIVSCAQIAIVVVYFLLCAEDYHWFWKSFMVSTGSAFYVLLYSVYYYYARLTIIGFVPTLLYFAYSFLIALTFAICTGTVGFIASYIFLIRIYGSVKID